MYKFNITIGDWCGGGHGLSDSFRVISNHPVERVREAHFRIKDATGIDIESLCDAPMDSVLSTDTIMTLRSLGFYSPNGDEVNEGFMNPFGLAKLWVFLLQKADPALKLRFVPEDIPSLHFHGTDEKGRRIRSVGYGLFYLA